ncbi:hypothetical protein ACIBIZ_38190 [Nonomuraea spiralis]|uniref:hypothetical protein n=1 Tax=Nonomuraea TaxID=83681 RepID=UPI001C8BCB02|nr:hypothetical protein [Nonomuraea sp. WAC 01424]
MRGVAEHLGNDRGWSLQYELAQRGLPGGAAREAAFLSNGGCVERPGLGELEEQGGERFGNRARWVAELEAYLGVVDADVVEGQAMMRVMGWA